MKNLSLRLHVLFFGALAVGLTWFLASMLVSEPHGKKYTIELTFLILAEVFATVASGVVLEENDETRPFGAMIVPVSFGYLLFTLAMLLFACFEKFPDTLFLCIHVVGVVAAAAASGLLNMGSHQIAKQAERDRVAMAAKKTFSTDALVALEEAKSRFASREDLIAKAKALAEDLQYAATSRPGSESADEALAIAVDELSRCASGDDEAAFEKALKEAERLHRARQVKIKML